MEAFLCVKCDDFHQNNWEGLTFKTIADTYIDMHMADTICRNAKTPAHPHSLTGCAFDLRREESLSHSREIFSLFFYLCLH